MDFHVAEASEESVQSLKQLFHPANFSDLGDLVQQPIKVQPRPGFNYDGRRSGEAPDSERCLLNTGEIGFLPGMAFRPKIERCPQGDQVADVFRFTFHTLPRADPEEDTLVIQVPLPFERMNGGEIAGADLVVQVFESPDHYEARAFLEVIVKEGIQKLAAGDSTGHKET